MENEQTITAQKANGTWWFAYVNGVMLRDKIGVGRQFKTEAAALRAARKSQKESK